jgi:hypothetical protein
VLFNTLATSAVIFLLAAGWVAVEKLRKYVMGETDACSVSRHECGHCLMMTDCTLKNEDEERATDAGASPAPEPH